MPSDKPKLLVIFTNTEVCFIIRMLFETDLIPLHTTFEHNVVVGMVTQGLFFTVLLGLYFTALQAYEYFEAPFTIADSAYGSAFFVATRFHGLHVITGTTFLTTCLLRHLTLHFSLNHHFGFEAAA
jgi:cytochrome c oxidase subunit 3